MKRRAFLKFPSFGLALFAPISFAVGEEPTSFGLDEAFLKKITESLRERHTRVIGTDGLSSAGISFRGSNHKVLIGNGLEISSTELDLSMHFFWGCNCTRGPHASRAIFIHCSKSELCVIDDIPTQWLDGVGIRDKRCTIPERNQLAFIMEKCEMTAEQIHRFRFAAQHHD